MSQGVRAVLLFMLASAITPWPAHGSKARRVESVRWVSMCEPYGTWMYVGPAGTSVFDAPGDSKIATLFPGVAVQVLEGTETGWLHIKSSGWTGYPSAVNESTDLTLSGTTLWASPEGRYTWGRRAIRNARITGPLAAYFVERKSDRGRAEFTGWISSDTVQDRPLVLGKESRFSWLIQYGHSDTTGTDVSGIMTNHAGSVCASIAARLEVYACDGSYIAGTDFGLGSISPGAKLPFHVSIDGDTGGGELFRISITQALFR